MPNHNHHVRMPEDIPVPPTLADIREYGVDVFCYCNRCHHHAVLPIAVLIGYCGPGLPFPAIHGRLRCQACGSRDITARPNWRGLGVVARHGLYEGATTDELETADEVIP